MSLFENIFDLSKKAKASRLAFGEKIAALGDEESKIVVLDGDLSKSTRTDLFAAKFPDRFFNMGIAEANMIGVAAGLARSGKIPFAASFGCFLTGRFDQIRMSVSFTGARVTLVGTHAGVGIGEDGHSQMALEDLALMRILPGMKVFQPADESDTLQIIDFLVKSNDSPAYLRLTRQNLCPIKNKTALKVGEWEFLNTAKASKNVAIVATGGVLEAAVKAADILISSGKFSEATIVNAQWIEPVAELNIDKILTTKPELIVSVEDHYPQGGLGGVLAERLSNRASAPKLLRIGVEGFGQSGSPEVNYQKYGFTPEAIAEKISRA
ncbi:MAG: transketolase family protein [Proteobacteria bacterium]|nr:transketolase family protein [Pseudomonadota bacterium]